jgi:hypothetical protein
MSAKTRRIVTLVVLIGVVGSMLLASLVSLAG